MLVSKGRNRSANRLVPHSIQTRVFLLMTLLAASLILAVLGLQSLQKHQARVLARRLQQERRGFYETLITLRGASLKSVSVDYTAWDEMAAYIRKPDKTWAKQNINAAALSTYDLDGLWVYDPAMRFVDSVRGDQLGSLESLPFPAGAVRRIRRGGPFYHFFLRLPEGLLELRGASVHPSSDTAHAGPEQGYLFSGRLWDEQYLKELGGITSTRASLIWTDRSSDQSRVDATRDKALSRPCLGWDDRPVADLELVGDDLAGTMLKRSERQVLILITIFSGILLSLVTYCLLRWVSHPLNLLARALRTEHPAPLHRLLSDPTEMGALAEMIREFFHQKAELKCAHDGLEQRVESRTVQLAEANQRLQSAYDATIEGWSRALDLRDHETEGHSRRVAEMTITLARSFGFSEEELIHLHRGALLHDIGKMGVPDQILLKPGPLTDDEFAQMQRHPSYAYELLSPIQFLRPCLDIPYCHHERWDGTGYPRRLCQDEIPLAARIFTVVDVWDALRSDRPYRRAWPAEKVRAHLVALAGTHFDPDVVAAILPLTREGELKRAA